MAKPVSFEDKYYVYVPTAMFKMSKQEFADFKEKNGDIEKFRDQYDLAEAIRRFRRN